MSKAKKQTHWWLVVDRDTGKCQGYSRARELARQRRRIEDYIVRPVVIAKAYRDKVIKVVRA